MAIVRLSRLEAEQGKLPAVCVCCGGSATRYQPRPFLWRSPRGNLTPSLFRGRAQQITVVLPLCDQDCLSRKRLRFIVMTGLLLTLTAILAAGIVSHLFSGKDGWVGAVAFLVRPLASLMGLLFVGLLVLLVVTTKIRALEITDQIVTLTGVSPEFVRAVEARRHHHAGTQASGGSENSEFG